MPHIDTIRKPATWRRVSVRVFVSGRTCCAHREAITAPGLHKLLHQYRFVLEVVGC